MENILEIATNNVKIEIESQELATKKDMHLIREDMKRLELKLQTDIYKSKFELIIWVVGLFIVSGLIQHFIK